MPFDQSGITSVAVHRDDVELLIVWQATSSPPFQVYVDRHLTWHGLESSCLIPWPSEEAQIDIGSVDPGEEETDFSADLPAAPETHATLTWTGGSYLDDDLAGFHVYMGGSAGAAIAYTTPVATVTAYPQNIANDGFGMGGWGEGGFGTAASRYSWRSDRLGPGTWNFGVKPFDEAGNEGTAATASVAILAPPRPPAADAFGLRLRYTYNPTTHVATLSWLASPA